MRHLRLALTAVAAGPVLLVTPAAAQEPSKQETIDWLIEKVEQSGVGCSTERVLSENGKALTSTTVWHKQSLQITPGSSLLEFHRNSSFEKYNHRSDRTTNSSFSSIAKFPASAMVPATMTVRESKDRVETTNLGRRGVLTPTCHALSIRFAGPVHYRTSSDGLITTNGILIEVRDLSLAERMRSAFLHLTELEKSGEGEPF